MSDTVLLLAQLGRRTHTLVASPACNSGKAAPTFSGGRGLQLALGKIVTAAADIQATRV